MNNVFRTNFKSFIYLLVILSLISQLSFAQSGKVKGTIFDKSSGEPLWGANVFVEGTSIGSATDMEGNYVISLVPIGENVLIIKYIGYQPLRKNINIPEPNRTLIVDAELETELIEGLEVVISAQAAGQISAINQQISAKSIKNVVSSARIQELPDATAAESVGRLPGVSINRSGGEANKVTIRGLAPKYNNVQLDGVTMGSTDQNDRSTDISMISPNALAGIEVTKAPTADMDAASLGGTINLTMREAPDRLYYDLLFQGGYDSQQESYKNYKVVATVSNRFFDSKLGVYFNGYLEERNRSTDILNPGFVEDFTLPIERRDESLRFYNNDYRARDEIRNRIGGSVVLDYKLSFGSLKWSNFFSRMDRDITEYSQNVRGVENFWTQSIDISGKNVQSQMISKLLSEFDNVLGGKLDASLSFNLSVRDQPKSYGYTGFGYYAMTQAQKDSIPTLEWINHINEVGFLQGGLETGIDEVHFVKNYGEDQAFETKLNYEYPLNIGDFATGSVKLGGLYNRHDRQYDKLSQEIIINKNEYSFVQNALMDAFPNVWINRNYQGQPFLQDTWDDNFKNDRYFNGDYDLLPFMNLDIVKQTSDFAFNYYKKNGYLPLSDVETFTRDQDGFEETYSAFIMGEFNLFDNKVTFIPGVRLENVSYDYKGLLIDVPLGGNLRDWNAINMRDTTARVTHENIFPMIHLRYKPFEWGDIRLAYTETVARPDFSDLIPYRSTNRNFKTLQAGNLNLRPQISQNWDISLSVYSNHIGLFTVGGFYKNIKDLIWRSNYFLPTVEDTKIFEVPERFKGFTYDAALNSDFEAEMKGLEISWQNNLWFLPKPFDGIVFDINYTYINSETRYPFPVLTDDFSTFPPTKIRIDSSYSGPIAGQPKNVINFSIGYDYQGFSARLSYLFQEGSLSGVKQKEYLSTFDFSYDRWDLKLSQKLPYNIELFFNISNLSDTPDESYQQREKYIDFREIWGLTSDLGLRYRL